MSMRTAEPTGSRGFHAAVALIFLVSAAATVACYRSMAQMPGMEMPGGWSMSMTWMRMHGQTRAAHFLMFVSMWVLMMAAMMLPVLLPMLEEYRRRIVGASAGRRARLTAVVAASYFAAWTVAGAAVYPFGVGFAGLAMDLPQVSRLAPIAAGIVVMIAGASQLSAWKARQLACCRSGIFRSPNLTRNYLSAAQHGLLFGARCVLCCAGLTAILLVIGVMDLAAMAVVGLAIAAERLSRRGERVARVTGAAGMAWGVVLIAQGVMR